MNPTPTLERAVQTCDAMLAKFSNPEKRREAFDQVAKLHDKWLGVVYPVPGAVVVTPEIPVGVVGETVCVGQDDCQPPEPSLLARTLNLFRSTKPQESDPVPEAAANTSNPDATHVFKADGPITLPPFQGVPEGPETLSSPLPEKATLRILSSCINPRFLRAELPDKRKVSIMILRGRRYRVGIELNCRLQQAAQAIYVPLV